MSNSSMANSQSDDTITRGEVWLADLLPDKQSEQGRARLVLIVSVTKFNNGPAGLVVVLPITTRNQNIPAHVKLVPPEGGVNKESFILCEQVQCFARDRLMKRLGYIGSTTMKQVEDRLCILLNLFEPV